MIFATGSLYNFNDMNNSENKYFLYCRKSSEDEDRQILSIESQTTELKRLAERLNLGITEIFTESKSAKEPGRIIFNLMIKRIEKGEATGIIVWKLDRLTRNPIDSGRINWLLQTGVIKHIRTFEKDHFSEDNVLPLDVEFSMANQYIRDLSVNVKRGLRRKVEKGLCPGLTPIGYLNDKFKEKGEKDIIKDPERFLLVRKMWDLALAGYNPPRILEIATNYWGLRTKKSKRRGGKPLSLSGIYRIFSNPFYSGWFRYKGNLYKGNHPSMINPEEFERVQLVLRRNDTERPQKHRFAYTGLMKCGNCGCSITAETKTKIQKNGNVHHYTYYRCTKRKKEITCPELAVREKEFEKQVGDRLLKIQLPEEMKDWAIKHLDEKTVNETETNAGIKESLEKALLSNQRQLDNLTKIRIRELVSDEEYLNQKEELIKERILLDGKLKRTDENNQYIGLSKETFVFSCYARFWLENGSPDDKKLILRIFGSDLFLTSKKLFIQLKNQFQIIEKGLTTLKKEKERFGPLDNLLNSYQITSFPSLVPILSDIVDDVRTYWKRAILEDNSWVEFDSQMKELLKRNIDLTAQVRLKPAFS